MLSILLCIIAHLVYIASYEALDKNGWNPRGKTDLKDVLEDCVFALIPILGQGTALLMIHEISVAKKHTKEELGGIIKTKILGMDFTYNTEDDSYFL